MAAHGLPNQPDVIIPSLVGRNPGIENSQKQLLETIPEFRFSEDRVAQASAAFYSHASHGGLQMVFDRGGSCACLIPGM